MKICIYCNQKFNQLDWQCPHCSKQPKILNDFLAFAPELAQESEGFEAHYFDSLAKVEAKNFWFRNRNRLIIWAFSNYFKRANNFLEIGCGTGFVLSGIERAFPTLNVYGSEIFTNGLNFANQRLTKAQLFQMDAQNIPFDQEFDVIGAFDVIEHIQEDTKVLEQMYKATKTGGGIIITVPQHPWLWSQADDYAHHVRRYTERELKIKIKNAGFKIIRVSSFVSVLLPLMMMSRMLQQKPNAQYNALSELKISGGLNATLEMLLNLERKLIELGLSFPFGGSLLLVAQK